MGGDNVEALFTSKVGGAGLRDRILAVIRDAVSLAGAHQVDVHIMTFSFTDAQIADLLVQAARSQPNLSIRLIADWNQGAEGLGTQSPWHWPRSACPTSKCGTRRTSPTSGTPTHAGCDGRIRPVGVSCTTRRWRFWSTGAHTRCCAEASTGRRDRRRRYENLIVLSADDPASIHVMTAVEREFEALWSDGAATLSPDEVRTHYAAVLAEYQRDSACAAADVVGVASRRRRSA